MKISQVNATHFGGTDKLFSTPRVKIVGKVDGYVEQMIRESLCDFESLAEAYKINSIKLAQKNNLFLVNSGIKTKFFDLTKMKQGSDFDDNIVNNIRENGELLSILG